MSNNDYTYYRAPEGDTYRIHLEQDQDAESPRGDSNVSTLITFDRSYNSPDKGMYFPFPGEYYSPYSNDAVDVRRIRKYAALFMPEILYVTGLNRNDYDGTLSTEDGDDAGGVAFVTRESWNECMGADCPVEGGPWLLTRGGKPDPDNSEGNRTPSAAECVEQEVATYNRWASGEYVGFVVEKREEWIHAKDQLPVKYTWEDTDSVWGFDDEKYALEEAIATLPEGSVEIDESEIDEEDEES